MLTPRCVTPRGRLATACAAFGVASVMAVGSVMVTPAVAGAAAASTPVSTRLPSLAGSGTLGSVLTLTPGTFSNETTQDGTWEQCPTATSTTCSATTNKGNTYTVSTSDPVGDYVRLKEVATNANGSTTAWSNAVGPVPGPGPVSTRVPSLAGSGTLGSVITLTPGTFSNETTQDGTWEQCPTATSTACAATTNTGSSYTVSTSDPVGDYIRLKETATNASASTTVWSNAIGPTTGAPPGPVNTLAPRLAGLATQGSVITLTPGTFSNETTQDGTWQRCPTATSTACAATTNTGSSYTVSTSDPVGDYIRLKETATNASASTTVWSNAIGPITAAIGTSPPGDPLGGDRFYVNPSDSAVTEERQLQATGQTSAAGQIETIASQPEATWLTSDGSTSVVPGIMSAAAGSATVPVFVLYYIPWRDCGQYSSGGASSVADYEGFINSVVNGLGTGRAVVIVEPDALSELSCLSSSQQQTYYQLIGYAAKRIDSDANASVYVDAGHPGWQPAATEASELQQALGTTKAGFAVNVSNFGSTASDVAYGTAISQAAGGRHFVIDTSRNGGSVASGQWCNPAGAGIGANPTTNTANSLVDADLWIKDVGESDGTCNGGPAAGQFWLSYALDLVANG